MKLKKISLIYEIIILEVTVKKAKSQPRKLLEKLFLMIAIKTYTQ